MADRGVGVVRSRALRCLDVSTFGCVPCPPPTSTKTPTECDYLQLNVVYLGVGGFRPSLDTTLRSTRLLRNWIGWILVNALRLLDCRYHGRTRRSAPTRNSFTLIMSMAVPARPSTECCHVDDDTETYFNIPVSSQRKNNIR